MSNVRKSSPFKPRWFERVLFGILIDYY